MYSIGLNCEGGIDKKLDVLEWVPLGAINWAQANCLVCLFNV
jgi:hypothetical protein